jgi:hypothetical protein
MNPPSKRQKLDTAMDATPSSQPLPPGYGSEFDKKVLESCAEGGLVEAAPLIGMNEVTLLIAILKNDKGLVKNTLNFDYTGATQAMELVTEHPELRTRLQTAWESKKFEEIRQLRKCLRSNIPLH